MQLEPGGTCSATPFSREDFFVMILSKTWNGLNSGERRNRHSWVAVCAMLAAMVIPAAAQNSQPRPDRIAHEISSGAVTRIAGSVHPQTRQANDLGPVSATMRMDLMLNIGLSAAQETEAKTLLEGQMSPQSPLYHHWLTQAEYGRRFGLTDADVQKVTAWLASEGFAVRLVAPARNLIMFSGTAGQVETTFRTQVHEYTSGGERHIANSTEVWVPAALAGVVTHVGGMSGFRPKPAVKRANLTPEFTSHVSGSHFLSPGDWATIYNVNAIYNAGYTGTGMHVGVVGQTYFPQSDIDIFRAGALLSPTKLTMVCMSSADCTDLAGESIADIIEANLDVEWAGGIAKDATVDYVYASASDTSYDVISALTYAIAAYSVNGAVLPVISMSYGSCELDIASSPAYLTAVDAFLQEAALQGQVILNSSGDSGAACKDNGYADSYYGAVVSWPVGSPYVTGVGGTTFSGDVADLNTDAYWTAGSVDVINSARQYIPEVAWNDSSLAGSLSSSGGGVSVLYAEPSWQWAPSNYTGPSMRFVPDVSFSASQYHDAYLVCTENFNITTGTPTSNPGSTCVSGFRVAVNGNVSSVGGTSASSPSFGGMLTLLVQKYGLLGPINPTIYALAKNPTTYAKVFHDITSGDNLAPCAVNSYCTGTYAGYVATTGYDLVTGLGSIDGGALYTALASTALASTATTLSAQPATVPLGLATTLTANVSSPAGGTVSGIVTFLIGTSTLGTASISGGSATLSNLSVSTANGFTTGIYPVTASYGGSSSFGLSSARMTLTVVAAPVATATTVSGGPVAGGQTVTLTAVVTATTGTPTGTVTFKTGATTLGTAPLISGVATLGVQATAANGLGLGEYTVTASYGGDAGDLTSAGSFVLVVYDPALPLVVSLSPNAATKSGVAFALTVNGANFAATSKVLWNGQVRATTFVSSAQLTATIPASDIASEGVASVTVANLSAPAGTSAAVPLVVMSTTPVATVTRVTVAAAAVNGSYPVGLMGTDFVASSAARWNAANRTTAYDSPGALAVTITAADATTRPATVTVNNPSGLSAGFTLR